jgi:hypothetical protein
MMSACSFTKEKRKQIIMDRALERRKLVEDAELAEMYNMHNNAHIEKQKQQIQQQQEQQEEQKMEELKSETQPYLEQTTSSGIGVRGRSHPLYKTTNMNYGAKQVTEMHKPVQYHGQNGTFTKEFVGGMFRNHSLNCNKARNSTVRDPSFGTNDWFEHGI